MFLYPDRTDKWIVMPLRSLRHQSNHQPCHNHIRFYPLPPQSDLPRFSYNSPSSIRCVRFGNHPSAAAIHWHPVYLIPSLYYCFHKLLHTERTYHHCRFRISRSHLSVQHAFHTWKALRNAPHKSAYNPKS